MKLVLLFNRSVSKRPQNLLVVFFRIFFVLLSTSSFLTLQEIEQLLIGHRFARMIQDHRFPTPFSRILTNLDSTSLLLVPPVVQFAIPAARKEA